MRKLRTLDALLPKTRQGILAATLVQPEKAWYVSELARRMGVPSSSLQRELRDLSEVGILKTHRQGHMGFFAQRREKVQSRFMLPPPCDGLGGIRSSSG